MNGKQFGALVATAVALLSGTALAADSGKDDAKACYRKSCGSSVKGHSGSCAGTKVSDIKDEKTCTDAGGAWTTAEGAKSMEDMH